MKFIKGDRVMAGRLPGTVIDGIPRVIEGLGPKERILVVWDDKPSKDAPWEPGTREVWVAQDGLKYA